jgi:hypothetical protein
MPDIEPVVILVATVVCFALGAVYYAVLSTRLAELSGTAGSDVKAPPWALVVEVLRCLVLAAVVAGLAAQARVDGLAGGLVLGLVLWIGSRPCSGSVPSFTRTSGGGSQRYTPGTGS